MKITKILPIAIIAVLPFTVNAANIQGAMYTAPQEADENHPAPTTSFDVSDGNYFYFGRMNIDTADQEHVATTAYVKGAYNSAIAAVNGLSETITNMHGDLTDVIDAAGFINEKANNISDTLDAKRVKIYTTWDNDTDAATTLVPFATAQ